MADTDQGQDQPKYVTQEALNAALKDMRERSDKASAKLREELAGSFKQSLAETFEGFKTGLPDLLKPHLPQQQPPAGEGDGKDKPGEGGDDKAPKGPFAARVAQLEREKEQERKEREALAKKLEQWEKDRERERKEARQRDVESRKESARRAIAAKLAEGGVKGTKLDGLLAVVERSKGGVALKFDDDGNATLVVKRSRYKDSDPEEREYAISDDEAFGKGLADLRETDLWREWAPASTVQPGSRQQVQQPQPGRRPQIVDPRRDALPPSSADESDRMTSLRTLQRLQGAGIDPADVFEE